MNRLAAIVVTGVAIALASATGHAGSRVALIIGNSDYQWSPLKNPANDASDMAAVLTDLGFDVDVQTDVRRVAMHRAIRQFGNKLEGAEIGLFYYAGHGVQVEGRNYLVPVDADIREEDEVAFETIDAGRILQKMESAKNPVNIVVLDACRNNPFASNSRTASRGLARMDSPIGSLLLYATAPNKTAADGEGRNGVLTGNLIEHLTEPGLPLNEVILRTRVGVMEETSNQQVPWSASSLTRNVVLNQFASADPSQAVSLAETLGTPAATVVEKSTGASSVSQAEKLMPVCNKHYEANRLTAGAGGNALSCYQRVLELDQFNFEALEGIERIANKYRVRAENAIAAERYASAERHLENLKAVNPEHSAVEELEYALRLGLFSSAITTPNSDTFDQMVGNKGENALSAIETAAVDTASQKQTAKNDSDSRQPELNGQFVIAAVSDSSAVETAVQSGVQAPGDEARQQAATDVRRQPVSPAPLNPIPGLKFNPPQDTSSTVRVRAPTEKSVEEVIRFAEQPASSPPREQTEPVDDVQLALAETSDGQPYRLCPQCMQPAAPDGSPCIQHEVLKSIFTPSITGVCHTMINGQCMDVEYKFRIENICTREMRVEWAFQTFSGGTLVGRKRLPGGGDVELTCLNKQQDCQGRIRYAWDMAN